MVTEIVTPRIAPLEPPYEPGIAAQLAKMMPPGAPPIALFRTFVRNPPMAEAMSTWGSYELSRKLSLTMRDREIVIGPEQSAPVGMCFMPVPDAKTVKKRVHLDLTTGVSVFRRIVQNVPEALDQARQITIHVHGREWFSDIQSM